MRKLKVLIACEYSQIVTEAFALRGCDVTSCDLEEGEKGYNHYQGDVRDVLHLDWDLIVAFPPCTYFAKAQLWRVGKEEGRKELQNDSFDLVKQIYSSAPFVAIENPIGFLNTNWKKPDQITQPFEFGSTFHKEICLWLKGLRPLQVDPRKVYKGKTRSVGNLVNARMTAAQKTKIKSRFFPELAAAMADQWIKQISEFVDLSLSSPKIHKPRKSSQINLIQSIYEIEKEKNKYNKKGFDSYN